MCRKLDSSTDHLTCWHFVSKLGRSCERWARYHWYSFHVKNQILPMSDNVSKWSWVDRWSFPIKSMQSTYKSPPDSPGKISLVLYHVVKDLSQLKHYVNAWMVKLLCIPSLPITMITSPQQSSILYLNPTNLQQYCPGPAIDDSKERHLDDSCTNPRSVGTFTSW